MYCYGIGIICCTANRDLVVLRSAVLGGGEGVMWQAVNTKVNT